MRRGVCFLVTGVLLAALGAASASGPVAGIVLSAGAAAAFLFRRRRRAAEAAVAVDPSS